MAETSKPQGLSTLPAPGVEDAKALVTTAGQMRLKLSAHQLLSNRVADHAQFTPPRR